MPSTPKTPIVTKHPNVEVDIVTISVADISPFIGDDKIKAMLDEVLNSIGSSTSTTPSIDAFLGEGSIENGGTIGSIMSLLREHISASSKAGELTKSELGKVYTQAIQQAISGGIAILKNNNDIKLDMIKAKTSVLETILGLEKLKFEKEKSLNEANLASFELNVLGPLRREELKEKVEAVHLEHDIRLYYKDNMQVQEKEMLEENVDLVHQKIVNAEYENKLVLAKIDSEKSKVKLTDSENSLLELDKDIKTDWINIAMQNVHGKAKWDNKQSEAKSIIEMQNAGYDRNGAYNQDNSLPLIRMSQMRSQTELYGRQKGSYDDIRYQKLLQTVMNYNAMIYPDLLAENTLIAWAVNKDTGAKLYNELVKADMAVPINNTAISTT